RWQVTSSSGLKLDTLCALWVDGKGDPHARGRGTARVGNTKIGLRVARVGAGRIVEARWRILCITGRGARFRRRPEDPGDIAVEGCFIEDLIERRGAHEICRECVNNAITERVPLLKRR